MGKISRQESTKWMFKLYLLAFFTGFGIFVLDIIIHLVQHQKITDNDFNQDLLLLALMWSLGSVVTGLDYFERKIREDKKESTNTSSGESSK